MVLVLVLVLVRFQQLDMWFRAPIAKLIAMGDFLFCVVDIKIFSAVFLLPRQLMKASGVDV